MPDLTELGFGLGALALIWVVVRYFISAVDRKDLQISTIIDKKDLQISTMVEKFSETINNHIDHQTTQSKKNTAVLRKLDKTIVLFIKKLDK